MHLKSLAELESVTVPRSEVVPDCATNMEMDANTKNIRRAVKREAERMVLLPRLSFIERSLIAFCFVDSGILEGENLRHWRGILQ